MTILETLRGISGYPIPLRSLTEIGERRGIDLMGAASGEEIGSREYKLCKADLYLWLSYAPDVSQGGQSYSFTDEQRRDMRRRANEIYSVYEPAETTGMVAYGYKGDRL